MVPAFPCGPGKEAVKQLSSLVQSRPAKTLRWYFRQKKLSAFTAVRFCVFCELIAVVVLLLLQICVESFFQKLRSCMSWMSNVTVSFYALRYYLSN